MADTAPGQGRSWIAALAPPLLFGVVLPFATYPLLKGQGLGEVQALLLISLWPAVETLGHAAVKRRVDEFGVLMLVLLLLGALSAVAYNSTRLLFLKDSAITGLLGLAYLGSLALPRPLMFYLGRKFATGGTAGGVAAWNDLWRYPGFRRAQYLLTLVWGLAFVAEAAVRVPLAWLLPTGAMVLVGNLLPFAVVAALVTWTISVAKKGRARAAAAQAEAQAEAQAAAPDPADGAPQVA
ncbi:VC0807 family protein [Actinomadura parmotrematis]|uniref:DUF3159 domain-containing protein n=1 Tax=Actinomadura parmotrematis TaxID=2864039 RepID=A0ABS7FP92_9ACTN|nr:VC0807 family protein [Actinomadura parmotrematis]MBW8482210.1 hypothetical protein [Actinomadura parmotrematis]